MGSSLAHVMVVAGTPRDWDELDERAWSGLATALGQVVADAGGAWLTLRAYEAGDDGPTAPAPTADRRSAATSRRRTAAARSSSTR